MYWNFSYMSIEKGGLNFEISQLLHELGIQKNVLTFVL